MMRIIKKGWWINFLTIAAIPDNVLINNAAIFGFMRYFQNGDYVQHYDWIEKFQQSWMAR